MYINQMNAYKLFKVNHSYSLPSSFICLFSYHDPKGGWRLAGLMLFPGADFEGSRCCNAVRCSDTFLLTIRAATTRDLDVQIHSVGIGILYYIFLGTNSDHFCNIRYVYIYIVVHVKAKRECSGPSRIGNASCTKDLPSHLQMKYRRVIIT